MLILNAHQPSKLPSELVNRSDLMHLLDNLSLTIFKTCTCRAVSSDSSHYPYKVIMPHCSLCIYKIIN